MNAHEFVVRTLQTGGREGRRKLAKIGPCGWLVDTHTREIIRPALEAELRAYRYVLETTPRQPFWPPPGTIGFNLRPFAKVGCDGPPFYSLCGQHCSIALIPGATYSMCHLEPPRAGMQVCDEREGDHYGITVAQWSGCADFEIALGDAD